MTTITLDSIKTYQACTRCIMDTSDPFITFDEQGICNHCHRFDERLKNEVKSGDEARRTLGLLVEQIKKEGKGKDYDCIVGVSGGVDSSMVAYHVKKLGLRPLAVHLDNGWNSELAVENIKHLLTKLDIDLYTHVIDWEEFKDLQLSFLKASVPNCEIPTDHAINAILFKTALKYGVKTIISGGNVATEGILPSAWVYFYHDLFHLKSVHRRFGKKKLKTFPRLGLFHYLYLVMVRKFRVIPILNYLDYKKSDAVTFLEKELGWRSYGAKHFESIYTRFYQAYLLPTKFHFDKRRAHYSTLIAAGELSRVEALKLMDESPYKSGNLREDKEFVLKKFDLTEAQFEELMSRPAKKHQDYPSSSFLLEGLKGLRLWFKKRATKI